MWTSKSFDEVEAKRPRIWSFFSDSYGYASSQQEATSLARDFRGLEILHYISGHEFFSY